MDLESTMLQFWLKEKWGPSGAWRQYPGRDVWSLLWGTNQRRSFAEWSIQLFVNWEPSQERMRFCWCWRLQDRYCVSIHPDVHDHVLTPLYWRLRPGSQGLYQILYIIWKSSLGEDSKSSIFIFGVANIESRLITYWRKRLFFFWTWRVGMASNCFTSIWYPLYHNSYLVFFQESSVSFVPDGKLYLMTDDADIVEYYLWFVMRFLPNT